jgi:hypothetical protein
VLALNVASPVMDTDAPCSAPLGPVTVPEIFLIVVTACEATPTDSRLGSALVHAALASNKTQAETSREARTLRDRRKSV